MQWQRDEAAAAVLFHHQELGSLDCGGPVTGTQREACVKSSEALSNMSLFG
jgi:hypothetical protein